MYSVVHRVSSYGDHRFRFSAGQIQMETQRGISRAEEPFCPISSADQTESMSAMAMLRQLTVAVGQSLLKRRPFSRMVA